MNRIISQLIIFFIFCIGFLSLSFPVSAAAIYSGESVYLDSTTSGVLSNAYLFGSNVTLNVPVERDLVAAGGTLVIHGPISQSANIAGGNITIDSPVGNSIRVAGGNITISGPVKGDVVAVGGSVTLLPSASVAGDLIFSGGQVDVEGPIAGKVTVNGGQVRINNTVGKGVTGHVNQLILGSHAVVHGDVSYSSSQKAQLENGAQILGKAHYTYVPQNRNENQSKNIPGIEFLGFVSFLTAIGTILYTLAFVYLLNAFVFTLTTDMRKNPWITGLIGFAVLILMPIAALILLFIFLLGIPVFLLYFVFIAIAVAILNAFTGAFVVMLFTKQFTLDWKAAVVGPIVLLILHIIPIIGWFVEFVVFLMAFGAIGRYFYSLTSLSRPVRQK